MQIIDRPTVDQSWLTPEEQVVTFQIALVGCDGLVIGSDRLGRHARMVGDKYQPSQIVYQSKYCMSTGQSLVCFAAGGAMAQNVARRIVLDCDPASKLPSATELEWQTAIHQIVRTEMLPYKFPVDEWIVARTDTPDAFFVVSRKLVGEDIIFASVQKMQQHFCTGNSTLAQFLPRHLWTKDRSVSELEKLALLTLSYASEEDPSSIGAPFDIMALDKGGQLTWSVHKPIHEKFQSELQQWFTDVCEI
jgi:hypothetical protein